MHYEGIPDRFPIFPCIMYNIGVASVRVGRFKDVVEWPKNISGT